eukprot:TRINITY_DN20802_c0_g1_i1.p1 TRINITY_DN20802_c0_g1~~TRINITY_DN20802_c0_g1_i1.p1  ORF type:complete len:391 (-),score=109.06 TRINITY_DN20802_c0_g1_i1:892-2007(-)
MWIVYTLFVLFFTQVSETKFSIPVRFEIWPNLLQLVECLKSHDPPAADCLNILDRLHRKAFHFIYEISRDEDLGSLPASMSYADLYVNFAEPFVDRELESEVVLDTPQFLQAAQDYHEGYLATGQALLDDPVQKFRDQFKSTVKKYDDYRVERMRAAITRPEVVIQEAVMADEEEAIADVFGSEPDLEQEEAAPAVVPKKKRQRKSKASASEEGVAASTTTRKRRGRRAVEVEDGDAAEDVGEVATAAAAPKKKRAARSKKAAQDQTTNGDGVEAVTKKKRAPRKKTAAEDGAGEPVEKPKRKRKSRAAGGSDEIEADEDTSREKTSKRAKTAREEHPNQDDAAGTGESTPPRPKRTTRRPHVNYAEETYM